jgi:hypothetical protein
MRAIIAVAVLLIATAWLVRALVAPARPGHINAWEDTQ